MKNDLISRQAAIDALEQMRIFYSRDDCPNIYAEYKRIIDEINNLPSAQPEITADDVKKYCLPRNLAVITSEFYEELLRSWPSAQPEIVRCKDCRWWDKYGDYDSGYCMAAKHGYWSEHWDISIRRTYKGDFYCADAERRTYDC